MLGLEWDWSRVNELYLVADVQGSLSISLGVGSYRMSNELYKIVFRYEFLGGKNPCCSKENLILSIV